jgi:hypothetical protein
MIDTTTLICPATVTDLAGPNGKLGVLLPDGEAANATLALAVPYSPSTGDRVLVLGPDPAELYVVGVLQGRGTTTLDVPGDLHLRAARGAITIAASKGVLVESEAQVELRAPHIGIHAGKLDLVATRIVQRAKDVYQWVSGLLQTKGKRVRIVVESTYHLRARRTYVKGTNEMNIDGDTINIG